MVWRYKSRSHAEAQRRRNRGNAAHHEGHEDKKLKSIKAALKNSFKHGFIPDYYLYLYLKILDNGVRPLTKTPNETKRFPAAIMIRR